MKIAKTLLPPLGQPPRGWWIAAVTGLVIVATGASRGSPDC